jgi:hypothetical protein
MLGILALLFGVFSGMALLSYSGHEPVNMVYFMAKITGYGFWIVIKSLIGADK